jgi:hypothetical protein
MGGSMYDEGWKPRVAKQDIAAKTVVIRYRGSKYASNVTSKKEQNDRAVGKRHSGRG